MLLEIAANLCAGQHQANNFFAVFFSVFELGGITKHLMTGHVGNSEFCFPSGKGLRKQNSLFPLGAVSV